MSEENRHYAQVRKRDGRVVDFEAERIRIAASKALKASGMENEKLSRTICDDVLASLSKSKVQDDIPDIELIQDMVERAFIKRGLSKTAKLFIIYREQENL